jgi:hypothetical protein
MDMVTMKKMMMTTWRGWVAEVDAYWEPLDEVGCCTPLFVASGLSVLVAKSTA